MTCLEDIKSGVSVRGISPQGLAKVVGVEWYGDQAIKVVYEDGNGAPNSRLIFRNEEDSLEVDAAEGPWSFDGDGALLRLVSEADRIRLAHLFDPYLAVHTSRIDPLPHQITAVYGEMLSRQPLRFLLADDPGAGKTIMTGLLIKELMVRGDLERCLIVTPGNLVEQWQDELSEIRPALYNPHPRPRRDFDGQPLRGASAHDRPTRHAEQERRSKRETGRRA